MELGNFSVSMEVKDLSASRDFYEKLGLEVFVDHTAEGWLILRNQTATIGLFQGMFEGNLLTFNPGWDRDASRLERFMDIRDIQKELVARGLLVRDPVDETTSGPASFVVVDPDGNRVLIDQHV
jgi:catechol 2,3-dioxygenase-like lactoylglutathione lyase family enzyme